MNLEYRKLDTELHKQTHTHTLKSFSKLNVVIFFYKKKTNFRIPVYADK